MAEFLTLLEGSALGQAVRGMGVWSYGVINLVHILGISLLFGSIVVLDLRLMGLWRRLSLAVIATPILPLAALGFTTAAISGICLISVNATDYVGNPVDFSSLFAWEILPRRGEWDQGNRRVLCVLVDYNGDDLRGSAWQQGW